MSINQFEAKSKNSNEKINQQFCKNNNLKSRNHS